MNSIVGSTEREHVNREDDDFNMTNEYFNWNEFN